jgi:hypothetical protein
MNQPVSPATPVGGLPSLSLTVKACEVLRPWMKASAPFELY